MTMSPILVSILTCGASAEAMLIMEASRLRPSRKLVAKRSNIIVFPSNDERPHNIQFQAAAEAPFASVLRLEPDSVNLRTLSRRGKVSGYFT